MFVPLYAGLVGMLAFLQVIEAQNNRRSDSQLSNAAKELVILDVYYETNCPDSMRFITRQLYPLHQEMKDVLKINLVPFGKATAIYNQVTELYNFTCHHGAAECYGNTVQTCAISLYPNTDDHLSFINCMELHPRPSSAGGKCARRLSLDWKRISKCADGEEGNRLLFEMSELTKNLRPQLHFVPWIVVNKVYTSDHQSRSLRNLKGVVCDNLKKTPSIEKSDVEPSLNFTRYGALMSFVKKIIFPESI